MKRESNNKINGKAKEMKKYISNPRRRLCRTRKPVNTGYAATTYTMSERGK